MNIWIGRQCNQIQGLLLHSGYNIGTVKSFVYCGAEEKTGTIPDLIRMKEPVFLEYNIGSKNKWKRTREMKSQSCIISKTSRLEEKSKSKNTVDIVQRTKIASQQQIILVKQVWKELRRGNVVYLALVLPKAVQPQGMTQQRKRE